MVQSVRSPCGGMGEKKEGMVHRDVLMSRAGAGWQIKTETIRGKNRVKYDSKLNGVACVLR